VSYNVITLPVYDQPGGTITEVPGSYADALLAAVLAAKGMDMRPLNHMAVARLHKYSPLQAWELYDGDEKMSLLTIQEAAA